MTDTWQGEERRSHPRVLVEREVHGKIQSVVEAPVVDVSMSGALLEVPSTLATATRYVLKLPLASGALELQGEVVRSYVHGFDRDERGQPSVRYRAALRFVELSGEQREKLEEFVRASTDGGPFSAQLSS